MRGGALVLAALSLAGAAQAPKPDIMLRAMREELERSRALRVVNLDPPYYIEYANDDTEIFSASATLGGLVSSRVGRYRVPRVRVRAGDYKFDNTNSVFADYAPGARFEAEQLPLDDNPSAIRHSFWLLTDRMYKGAVEALGGKRAALRNVTETETLNDFARAEPTRLVVESPRVKIDQALWEKRVRALSAVFREYPRVYGSSVEFDTVQSDFYLVNSEGTEVKIPERFAWMRVRGWSQAGDGMQVRDAAVLQWAEPAPAVSDAELERAVRAVAANVTALVSAPAGEAYSGPVLMEGAASAQLFAEMLGRNLRISRRPVSAPGRPAPVLESELEGRLGVRILPEWLDVVDDPTQKEWRGRSLFGHYLADMEGVVPVPLNAVEAGVLKGFLLTRQPVRGFEGSNGRARIPTAYGAKLPVPGNLFVRARQSVTAAELKSKLIELCRQRGKTYGLLVRKMDFPSSASMEELRRMAAGAQAGGSSRPASAPLLVWRVSLDGKEELVRGLRFRGLNTRSLKDLVAASDQMHVFEYLENGAPLAMMDAGGYMAGVSVIAPSILIDDADLELPREDRPKLPVVPPPTASAEP
ncbi:MAG: metallopeptidase TldD-related protein [Bryobacterales bacterium]|nr:metallopeptidase TldD-related protein [Bryobacterales bacterium]